MKAALLAVVIMAVAGIAFRLAATRNLGQAAAARPLATHPPISARTLSLPLYFEPNQGQTDPQVKYLARGLGYGLFLTANETVLDLQRRATKDRPATASVIRMHLDGASTAAHPRPAQPLPGKSSYFIGNDPSKWVRNIPQFGRVEYQSVYPGIDLVYYGNDHQLEYDFRVAPGADPNQIALNFQGASARVDAGDLVLTTSGGDICFHAPHIYQPSPNQPSGPNQQSGANQPTDIPGGFRLLAANKIGFTVGPYDHSRELIIDPVLNYSSYLGGAGTESLVQVAVDQATDIYLAGSTTAPIFPGTLPGTQNIFIAVLSGGNSPKLLYSTYLGSSGTDNLEGIAVDGGFNIYVAGTTTSSGPTFFPTTTNAFQTPVAGTHGFATQLLYATGSAYTLGYSTYLAGNGTDTVTGVAADSSQNIYVTGTTTSTNGPSNGFPSNSFAYQPCPFEPATQSIQTGCTITSGPAQFFASKISTSANLSGTAGMLYSTYFGGGYPATATSTGGGVAVDSSGYMYFTGTTTMQNYTGTGLGAAYPIVNAYQACLNQPGSSQGTVCSAATNPNNSDAILVKLNPSQGEPGAAPFFSTYLGGSSNDAGIAVAIDAADNAYVTGSTSSGDWSCPGCLAPAPFTYTDTSATNAFIAEISNQTATNTIFPLSYFAWLGGTTPDADQTIGQAIAVDAVGNVHLAGQTFSPNLPTTSFVTLSGYPNFIEQYCDAASSNTGTCNGDAFVALVNPSLIVTEGDYVTYLGGSGLDNGTGIAVDSSNNTYVAGTTLSPPSAPLCTPPNCLPPFNGFPITANALQSTLGGSNVANAFVTVLGSSSNVVVTAASGSPNPSPVNAGQGATFSFDITNNGPNPATNINFNAYIPTGFTISPTANVLTGSGTCNNNLSAGQNYIPCTITNLNAGATAVVQVVVTPPAPPPPAPISVSCTFSVNNGGMTYCSSATDQQQQDQVADFTLTASPSELPPVVNGNLAKFSIVVAPLNSLGYNGTITLTQSSQPSIVTSGSPTFYPSPTVTLDGTGSQSVTLQIQTVARPVSTGSLFRRTSFYASWLPIGGLSLVGLGIGAGRKRRRWIAGALLGLVAGLLLLQPACSSSSSNVTTNQGTAAGTYHITVTGSSSTNASHQVLLTLVVT
jgi:uncharacterized repeat protein (TIGR01451 family)